MDIKEGDLLRLLTANDTKIWMHDVATDMVYFFQNDFSMGEGEPLYKHMQLKHPDDRDVMGRADDIFNSTHTDQTQLSYRYIDPSQEDGYRYIDACIIAMRDADGKIIRHYGSEKDVTARINQLHNMQRQSQQIQTLMLHCKDLLWTVDVKADTIYMNVDNETQVVDMKLDKFLSRADKSCVADIQNGVAQMREGKDTNISIDFRGNLFKSGSSWLTWRLVGIPNKRDSRGRILSYTGMAMNITEWDDNQRQLAGKLEKAEEQSRKKSLFVAQASHDIRTPLNGIIGVAQMLCEDISLEERKELFPLLKLNSDILLSLINDILDLSKIEAGKMVFNPTRFNLKDLMEQERQSFSGSITETQKFDCIYPEQEVVLGFDKMRLLQVINNFMSNAIKFTPEGSITLTATYSDAKGLYVEVADTGIGISEENQPKVFQQFQQFNHGMQGTGLGLSICKAIIESHGGEIGFKSKFGEGSTFWFRLPYASIEPKKDYPEDSYSF